MNQDKAITDRWWFWALLLLLLWWFFWRKQPAAAAAMQPTPSTSAPPAPPVSQDATDPTHDAWIEGQRAAAEAAARATNNAGSVVHTQVSGIGGGGTMAGYAKGDTSDAALNALGSETRAYLNQNRFWTGGADTGVGLYDAWLLMRMDGGPKVDEVKNQIRAMLDV